ncbi:hypothetical protein P3W24_12965 [Luteibacter sp. PPL201]|uniref:Uncharacterized protein n=1 Tax=Luteibacter sahnii TaxID=3021977 RepID=A0ABT6BCM3_9GAMM|nr:hypothetical protein [Luteibacter sp. PPL193]MDY1549304.1 hypothetical protein [Luteibacter sp. PPL193]
MPPQSPIRILEPRLRFPEDALARPAEGQPPDQLLKASVQDQDIVLTLTYPLPDPQEDDVSDVIQLVVDGNAIGEPLELRAYGPGDTIPLRLPASERPTTTTQDRRTTGINYKVTYLSGGAGVERGPDDQSFVTDIVRPGDASIASPVFSDDVLQHGVLLGSLRQDEAGALYLPAQIKGYTHQAIGDRITGIIDGGLRSAPVELTSDDIGRDITLRFYRDVLAVVDDGRSHAFTYDVEDRAGNVSVRPDAIDLIVSIAPRFRAALVPGAADGLVTSEDIAPEGGVRVLIPGNDVFRGGDTLRVTWNTHAYGPFTIDAANAGNDPVLAFVVPYRDVYGDWHASAQDSDVDVEADVDYEVFRGGLPFGQPASPAVAPVNLFGPGGEDPAPERPWHGNLRPPVVRAREGDPPNTIPADAIGKDAVATLPGVTAADPASASFRAGDRLQLYWDDQPVDADVVVVDEGVDVLRIVPGDVVRPGTWRVHYLARRRIAAGFDNVARSPSCDVIVMDPSELPGAGEPLQAAVWMEGTDVPPQIDYTEAQSGGGTPVRILRYANMKVGDHVSATFRGYRTTVPNKDPIDESLTTFRIDVTDDDERNGYVELVVPTDTLMLIDYGSATFDYCVTNTAGRAQARQAWVYVSTRH